MPRLDREILSNIFCLLWRGLMGSGPRRPRISVRTDGIVDGAGGGARQVDRCRVGDETHSDGAAWFWTIVAGVHFELAEQPEVDMANFTGRPVVEEMLAVAICAFKDRTVDPCGVSGERSLRA